MFQFIKEITIVGFKSFADKTTIQFKDGLNMVVGPNGCGKSNIIDAFCWGLGENRLKNLRAQNHEELIFAGNDTRSSSGYASVSFVIDNSQNILNIDTQEVKVKRTLNKNQESEYFINERLCRLKDIQQLFMDTGLGRHGYSIMQQGKIDQIITGKPQERRQIFEEASGISLSKMMIRESENKLIKTKENMNRLRDIISEVEVQVVTLEKQAQRAMQFKETKKEIETLEKDIFIYRYIDLEEKIKSKDEKQSRFEKDLESLTEQEESIKQEGENFFYEIGTLEDRIDLIKDKEKTLLVGDARVSQKMELMKVKHSDIKEMVQKLKDKQSLLFKEQGSRRQLLEDLEEKKGSLKESEDKLLESKKDLIKEIEGYNNLIKENQEQIKGLSKNIDDKEKYLYENLLEKQKVLISIVENLEDPHKASSEKMYSVKEYQDLKARMNQLKSHFILTTPLTVPLDYDLFSKGISDLRSGIIDAEKILDFLPDALLEVFKIDKKSTQSLHQKDEKAEVSEQIQKLKKEKQDKEKYLSIIEEEKQKALNEYEKEFLIKDSQKDHRVTIEVQFSRVQEELSFYDEQLYQIEKEKESLEDQQRELQDDIFSYAEEFEQFQKKKKDLEIEILDLQSQIKVKTELIHKMKSQETDLSLKKNQLIEKIQKLYLDSKEGSIQQDILKKDFFEKYKLPLAETVENHPEYKESLKIQAFNIIEHQKMIQEKKSLLENIGLVNFLAIEEYHEVNERYQYLLNNEKDIEKSQQDLLSLIDQVNKKATQDFMDVFNQVNKNLSLIFNRAFEGGSCEMVLLDKTNPLESGIDIIAKPPGKKLQSLILLSGGEKTMVTLSLMFSLFMVKPSPFCLLDEVDAALDELNIQRFLRILNDFKSKVQFLIITHNRITAQKGDVFYGVTMQETGVTKVFSFKPDNNKDTESLVTA